jgi:DNA polymerase-1
MKPATQEAYQLLHDGTLALSCVEENGIRIDLDYLKTARKKAARKIEKLEAELQQNEVWKIWKRQYGPKAKLGSRDQLSHILFRVMKFPVTQVTGGGDGKAARASTRRGALEAVDHPFVSTYLRMESIKKADRTFLAGISSEVVEGYLHPMFSLNTVRTYRSSSEKPNFQNFPIRDEEQAKLIRPCFIARPECQLVENDFGGVEVRVAVCYHKDPRMLSYIRDPRTDMHRDMAAQIFMLPVEQVSSKSRYSAKNKFVFPEFYGSYWGQCASDLWNDIHRLKLTTGPPDEKSIYKHLKDKGVKELGVMPESGKPRRGTFLHHLMEVEEDFWGNRFAVYADWKRSWYKKYQQTGGFRTLTGFVIEEVLGRNDVINYPIQGSAFHCLLWSLIELQKELKRRKMKSRIVGQIHDSIIGDVHRRELDDYLQLVKEITTVRLLKHWKWIIVPLEIEAEVCPPGGNWHQKEKVAI